MASGAVTGCTLTGTGKVNAIVVVVVVIVVVYASIVLSQTILLTQKP